MSCYVTIQDLALAMMTINLKVKESSTTCIRKLNANAVCPLHPRPQHQFPSPRPEKKHPLTLRRPMLKKSVVQKKENSRKAQMWVVLSRRTTPRLLSIIYNWRETWPKEVDEVVDKGDYPTLNCMSFVLSLSTSSRHFHSFNLRSVVCLSVCPSLLTAYLVESKGEASSNNNNKKRKSVSRSSSSSSEAPPPMSHQEKAMAMMSAISTTEREGLQGENSHAPYSKKPD